MKKIFQLLNVNSKATLKMVMLFLLYVAQAVCQVAQSEVLNRSTAAIESRDMTIVREVILFACVVLAGSLLVNVALKLRLRRFINDTMLAVQQDLLQRIMQFKRCRYMKHNASEYLTSIVDFAENMVDSAILFFSNTCASILTLIACTIYMAYLSVPLTALVVGYNVILRSVLQKAEVQIKKNVKECNRIVKENNTFLIEILENMLSIRVFRKEAYFLKKLDEHEENTYKSHIKAYIWKNGMSEFIWCTLKFAEFILVYGVGGILLYYEWIDFGVFLAYPVVMDYFVKGINQLLYALVDKNTVLAAIENTSFLYEEYDMENEADRAPFSAGEIRLEHVSFGFPVENGEHRTILKDVSLTIHPGEKVLLSGQNGQGKSTLLYLISGLLRPDSGEIYYDNTPLNKKNLCSISQNYALITQEHNLLLCTVPGNIVFGGNEGSENVKDLLEMLRIPYTIDQKVTQLSEGEKQRVNIARALNRRQKHPVFLLGDEIVANIDPENAAHIMSLIETMFERETVIMVCHGDTGFRWNKKITVENGKIAVEVR